MATYMTIIGGIPCLVSDSSAVYEMTITPGVLSANTPITLPSSKTYIDKELTIWLNGIKLELGVEWQTVGSPPRTQFSLTMATIASDRIIVRTEG